MKIMTSGIAGAFFVVGISLSLRAQAVPPHRAGFETRNVEVCGDLAVETGRVGSSDYVSVWRRQPDGGWKFLGDLREAGSTSDVIPGVASSTVPPAPAEETIPIPDPRDLSDGFVRTIQDSLRAHARRLRSGGGADAVAKADRYLRATIRDIGWINVLRFGVPTACDAAFIVSRSSDPPLMRAALPLIEKDLKNAEGGAGCAQEAIDAYEALTRR